MSNSGIFAKDQEAALYWNNLADDPVQKVIHAGCLYIIFDEKTMMDTGSANHRVEWRVPGLPDGEYRLIPQGTVPDWIKSRFPENVETLECRE